MQGLTHRPSFILRSIDVDDFWKRYRNGDFSSIKEPPPVKITLNQSGLAPAPEYGNSPNDSIFTIKDKGSRPLIVATDNDRNYQIFTKSGGEIPKGGRCFYCLQDFTHEVVGIPIQYKRAPELGIDHIFWTVDTFCDEECMYAKFRENLQASKSSDPVVSQTESLIKLLYRLKFGHEAILRPADDFRLIKENGGSIPYSEYKNKKNVRYMPKPNILLIPAKRSYMQVQYTSLGDA